jgi:ABC-2 type transport system ATP-binding protein
VGAVFGARGDALEERIEMELAAFSLASSADLRNETLSHGTRQRVALAQAFLHDPDLLVLDEPMVGLDPIAQKALADRLRSVAAKSAAVFFTTHQLSLAEELATRAGLLVKGRLVASGPPSALVLPTGRSATLSEAFFDLTRGEA